MKTKLVAIAFLCFAANLFAQHSDEYLEIVLDGKKAWMHKTTGFVKYQNQSKISTPKTGTNSPSITNIKTSSYKVIQDDTYYSISKEHNISVAQLLAWNELSKGQPLQIGKTLKVSLQNNLSKTYNTVKNNYQGQHVVVKGETLYSISREHGITVQFLKNKNNLKSSMIHIGQQLTIR